MPSIETFLTKMLTEFSQTRLLCPVLPRHPGHSMKQMTIPGAQRDGGCPQLRIARQLEM